MTSPNQLPERGLPLPQDGEDLDDLEDDEEMSSPLERTDKLTFALLFFVCHITAALCPKSHTEITKGVLASPWVGQRTNSLQKATCGQKMSWAGNKKIKIKK